MRLLPRDEEYRTQEQAIAYHNSKKERMLSMPDIFKLVKENNIEAIESLRKDFKDYLFVTSTRIIYNPENPSAKIIHNADSNVVKQNEISVKEIPISNSTHLDKLLETKAGLDYIRALIDNSKASKEELIKFFVALSGKKVSDIRFWTPSLDSRKDRMVRSVELDFNYINGFNVDGGNSIDNNVGFSRGVLVDSAKQTKFLSNKAIFDIEDKTIIIPLQKKLCKEIQQIQKTKKKVKISWKLKIQLK